MDKDMCEIGGCNKPVVTKGLCSNHYMNQLNAKNPERVAWRAMRQRCNNPNHPLYKNYGARGIKVCDRWNDKKPGVINFLEDMGKRPGKEYSLDRIDNDGDYTPENCRWATRHQQNGNTRANYRKSIPVGVRYDKRGYYRVHLGLNGGVLYVGVFKDLDKAIKARKNAEIQYGIVGGSL